VQRGGVPTPEVTAGDVAMSIPNALLQTAQTAAGEALQGVSQAFSSLQGYTGQDDTIEQMNRSAEMRNRRDKMSPLQRREEDRSMPMSVTGQALSDTAQEAHPVVELPWQAESYSDKAYNAALATSRGAGGFFPAIATGPLAPLTFAFQTAGQELSHGYDQLVAGGMSPDNAAATAAERALANGALQGAFFEFLPARFKAMGDAALNKMAYDGAVKFARGSFSKGRFLTPDMTIARNAAQYGVKAAEGAAFGATSQLGSNVIDDRPWGEGLGQAGAGMALAQAIMPRGMTRKEQATYKAKALEVVMHEQHLLLQKQRQNIREQLAKGGMDQPLNQAEIKELTSLRMRDPKTLNEAEAERFKELDAIDGGDKSLSSEATKQINDFAKANGIDVTIEPQGRSGNNAYWDHENNKMVVNSTSLSRTLVMLPKARRQAFLDSLLGEESVHQHTTPEQALAIHDLATPAERKAAAIRVYGNLQGVNPTTGKAPTPHQIGWEISRLYVQKMMGMTPSEIAASAGGTRNVAHAMVAVEQMIRKVRRSWLNAQGEPSPHSAEQGILESIYGKMQEARKLAEQRATPEQAQAGAAVPVENPFSPTRSEDIENPSNTDRGEKVSDHDLHISVQADQTYGDKTFPGYVQVDSIVGGKNQWSSNAEKLRSEGYDIPTTAELKKLPQGKYTLAQIKAMGNPSNATRAELDSVPNKDWADLSDLINKKYHWFVGVRPDREGLKFLMEETPKEWSQEDRKTLEDVKNSLDSELKKHPDIQAAWNKILKKITDARSQQSFSENSTRGGLSKKAEREIEAKKRIAALKLQAQGQEVPPELQVPSKADQSEQYAPTPASERVGSEALNAPQRPPLITTQNIESNLAQHLAGPIDVANKQYTAKQLAGGRVKWNRPGFEDFAKQVRYDLPGLEPYQLRDMWEGQVWKHLLNASGERLLQWVKALGLQNVGRTPEQMRKGIGGVAQVPETVSAEAVKEERNFQGREEALKKAVSLEKKAAKLRDEAKSPMNRPDHGVPAEEFSQSLNSRANDLDRMANKLRDLIKKSSVEPTSKIVGRPAEEGHPELFGAPKAKLPSNLPITPAAGPETTRISNRYRTKIIMAVADRLMRESMEGKPSLDRDSVGLDDIAFTNEKTKVGTYHEITRRDLDKPGRLLELVRDSARGSSADPVSASRRVLAVVGKDGSVYLLSTHNDAGKQRITEPSGPTMRNKPNRPLDATFLQKYRPIASILLTEPVRGLHQKFENLAEFNDKIASEAKQRSEINDLGIVPEGPAPEDFEAEGTPGLEGEGGMFMGPAKGALPAEGRRPALKDKRGLTHQEAMALYDHIYNKAGEMNSPDDLVNAVEGLRDLNQRGKLTNKELLAANALRKIFARMNSQGAEAESINERLKRMAKRILSIHDLSKDLDTFAEKMVQEYGGRTAEVAQPRKSGDEGIILGQYNPATHRAFRKASNLPMIPRTKIRPPTSQNEFLGPFQRVEAPSGELGGGKPYIPEGLKSESSADREARIAAARQSEIKGQVSKAGNALLRTIRKHGKLMTLEQAAKQVGMTPSDIREAKEYGAMNTERGSLSNPGTGSIFTTSTEKLLKGLSATSIKSEQLEKTISNKIPPVEWDILKKSGILREMERQTDQNGSVNPRELAKWVVENKPKIRVIVTRSSDAAQPNEPDANSFRMQLANHRHTWYDLLTHSDKENYQNSHDELFNGKTQAQYLRERGWKDHDIKNAEKMDALEHHARIEELQAPDWTDEGFDDGAEHYNNIAQVYAAFGIRPSQGEVHRVDVVLDSPNKYWKAQEGHSPNPNTIGWAAIQFVKPVGGKKPVAHIFEVQSDWAKRIALNSNDPNYRGPAIDPLVKDYNRLLVKAAISHAASLGADHFAITDYPTAAMSEGQDKNASRQFVPGHEGKWSAFDKNGERLDKSRSPVDTKKEMEHRMRMYEEGQFVEPGWTVRQVTREDTRLKPHGEQGMKFNYDPAYRLVDRKTGEELKRFTSKSEATRYTRWLMDKGQLKRDALDPKTGDLDIVRGDLHKIASEITGEEGRPVSFGAHENSRVGAHDQEAVTWDTGPQEFSTEREAMEYATGDGRVYKQWDGKWIGQKPGSKAGDLRKNLLFTNERGSAKTDASGMEYPVPKREEPWSMFGPKNSDRGEVAKEKIKRYWDPDVENRGEGRIVQNLPDYIHKEDWDKVRKVLDEMGRRSNVMGPVKNDGDAMMRLQSMATMPESEWDWVPTHYIVEGPDAGIMGKKYGISNSEKSEIKKFFIKASGTPFGRKEMLEWSIKHVSDPDYRESLAKLHGELYPQESKIARFPMEQGELPMGSVRGAVTKLGKEIWDYSKGPTMLAPEDIIPDTSSPLPRMIPNVDQVLTRAMGLERIPLIGRMFGPRGRIRDAVDRAIFAYSVKRGIGNSTAAVIGKRLAARSEELGNPFQQDKDGKITNVQGDANQSMYPSDLFEEWQRQYIVPEKMRAMTEVDYGGKTRRIFTDKEITKYIEKHPETLALNKNQDALFREMLTYIEDAYKYLDEKNAKLDYYGGESMETRRDQQKFHGLPQGLEVHAFPRVALFKRSVGPVKTEIARRIGGAYGVEKERLYKTEEQGQKTVAYEPDMVKRMVAFIQRTYKSVADADLANHPALGAKSPGDRISDLSQYYREEMLSGEMKPQDVADMVKQARLGTEGEVHGHAAFAGKIYTADVARRLNHAFGEQKHHVVNTISEVSTMVKAFMLTGDLAQYAQQGAPMMLRYPGAWANATVKSLRSIGDPNVTGRYLLNKDNYQAATEFIQSGGSLGHLQDFMSGSQPGELATRIPGLRQVVTRSGHAFGTFFDIAKIEMWKALRDSTPKNEWKSMVETIDNIVLSGKMESAGISPGRAAAERIALMAAGYYRGALQLIASTAEGGAHGSEARKVMASYLGGMAAMMTGLYLASGMSWEEIRKRLTPGLNNKKFLAYPVKTGTTTQEIGPGGIVLNLASLITDIGMHGNDPKAVADLSAKWLETKFGPALSTTTSLMTGKNAYGQPQSRLSTLGRNFMPVAAQRILGTATSADKVGQSVASAASFVGLRSSTDSPMNDIYELATKFLKDNNLKKDTGWEMVQNDEASLTKLRAAASRGSQSDFNSAYEELRKTHRNQEIQEAMRRWYERGFTNSQRNEARFRNSLNDYERGIYRAARDQKREVYRAFRDMYRNRD